MQVISRTESCRTRASRSHVDSYALEIRKYDLLDACQEQQLACRWRDLKDQEAANALVTSHLRLARKIAKGYQGYGIPLADLIAEANLGLMLAAVRFRPDRGCRFSTYAMWWIKAAIHEHILHNCSLVKIGTTAAQKRLFFRLRGELTKVTTNPLALTMKAAEKIAQSLGVRPGEVFEMNCRIAGDLSLNVPASQEEGIPDRLDLLEDCSPDAETIVAEQDERTRQIEALRAALNTLSSRERHIFETRRLSETPCSLQELGEEMALSSERIRQIEVRAFAKVRRATRRHFHEGSLAVRPLQSSKVGPQSLLSDIKAGTVARHAMKPIDDRAMTQDFGSTPVSPLTPSLVGASASSH